MSSEDLEVNKIKLKRKPKLLFQRRISNKLGKSRLYISTIAKWLEDRQILVEFKFKNSSKTTYVLAPPAGPCTTIYKAP